MEREIDRVAREVLDFLSRHAPESADQSSVAGEPMRERESLEEESTMGPPLSGFTFIDPPEYQHPDGDYNPYWETNEWVDAAYYQAGDYDDDSVGSPGEEM